MRRMGRRCLRARRGIGGTCTRSNNPRVAASFPRFCGERFDNYEIIEYIYKCACILIASLIYLLIRESEIFLENVPFRGNWSLSIQIMIGIYS